MAESKDLFLPAMLLAAAAKNSSETVFFRGLGFPTIARHKQDVSEEIWQQPETDFKP